MKFILTMSLLGMLLATAPLCARPGAVNRPAQTESSHESPLDRARLILLDDMGNEPDEVQQMTHVLMCSSEFELDGLLCVTSKFLRPEMKEPYKQKLHPELWHQLIDGYAKVYPNLQLHAAGWPDPDYLHPLVANGQPVYGMGGVGAGKATAGSRLIIAAVTKDDPRPVYFVMNAGNNTLAQALFDFRAAHASAEVKAFVAKLRVFDNEAQDEAGAWICHEFPDIFWIRSRSETTSYGGPSNTDLGPYVWQPYDQTPQGQDDWANEHIRTGHGALGELYPVRQVARKVYFIEGGGTIPWMGLVCRGLTDISEPSWGGWSGRYTAEKQPNVLSPFADVAAAEQKYFPYAAYTDNGVKDHWTDPADGKTYDNSHAAVWRWRTAMWNDFRARMEWCVQPYSQANHAPQAVLNGDPSHAILRLTARAGDILKFNAAGSTDPDGDALRYSWWIYPEAGRHPDGKELAIKNPANAQIQFTVPADAAGRELHLILEIWDNHPVVPLAAYRRAIIDVVP